MTAEPSPDAPDIHTTAGKLAELRRRNELALHPASPAALEKRHAAGKRTARERIERFMDEGSFVETDALTRHRARDFGLEKNRPTGDGVITGYGKVDGRMVADAVSPGTAEVTYEPDWDSAAPVVAKIARPGDLVITVGCGDVTKVAPQIVAALHRERGV